MDIFTYKPEEEQVYNNFIEKLNVGGESECWTWKAAINVVSKRPMFWFQGKWGPAARAVMYFKQGYLTEGLHVCHDPIVCDNKWCVNPFHLREDTPSANTKDLVITGNHNNKRKKYCPKNHEYDEVNTYYSGGRRYCRECKRQDTRKRRAKKKENK